MWLRTQHTYERVWWSSCLQVWACPCIQVVVGMAEHTLLLLPLILSDHLLLCHIQWFLIQKGWCQISCHVLYMRDPWLTRGWYSVCSALLVHCTPSQCPYQFPWSGLVWWWGGQVYQCCLHCPCAVWWCVAFGGGHLRLSRYGRMFWVWLCGNGYGLGFQVISRLGVLSREIQGGAMLLWPVLLWCARTHPGVSQKLSSGTIFSWFGQLNLCEWKLFHTQIRSSLMYHTLLGCDSLGCSTVDDLSIT